MSTAEVLQRVAGFGVHLLEITGGEPLYQPNALGLLNALCNEGYDVLLETSGAMPIRDVDSRVTVIMDIKTPGSGMSANFAAENLRYLNKIKHQIKFVVTSFADLDFALAQTKRHHLFDIAAAVMISVGPGLRYDEVAQWILETRLPFRLQLQLHKIIWPTTDVER